MTLSTRALKMISGVGAAAVCGASGLLVATDPKPKTAPLRPPLSSAPSTSAAGLLIPPSCGDAGGLRGDAALDPSLVAVVQQLRQAMTAAQRRTILATLDAQQRLQVEAYVRTLRRNVSDSSAACARGGNGVAAPGDPLAPSVVQAPALTQPLINSYVS